MQATASRNVIIFQKKIAHFLSMRIFASPCINRRHCEHYLL